MPFANVIPGKGSESVRIRMYAAGRVVYIAMTEEGRFEERTVRLGSALGDAVEVLDGVRAGERVVTEGSFYLRAEAGRARTSG